MSHSLSSYLCLGDLYSAVRADKSSVANLVVFSAAADPVLCRSEDPFAEKAVTLRLQCPVVDRLRFCDLTVRPLEHLFCGCELDLQGFNISKILVVICNHDIASPFLLFILEQRSGLGFRQVFKAVHLNSFRKVDIRLSSAKCKRFDH